MTLTGSATPSQIRSIRASSRKPGMKKPEAPAAVYALALSKASVTDGAASLPWPRNRSVRALRKSSSLFSPPPCEWRRGSLAAPVKAGTHRSAAHPGQRWVPAFTGMTGESAGMTIEGDRGPARHAPTNENCPMKGQPRYRKMRAPATGRPLFLCVNSMRA